MFLRNVEINIKSIPQTISCLRIYTRAIAALSNDNPKKDDSYNFKKQTPEDVVSIALENVKITEPKDWVKIQNFILNYEFNKKYSTFNEKNMDGIIIASITQQNRLDLARSYLKYMEEKQRKPNLATIGRYLKLLYTNCQDKISKEQESEILDICNGIKSNNPILDPRTLESMLLGLSLTKDWRKCIKILQEIKRSSGVSVLAYSALISAAFLNEEGKLAWDLLYEASSLDKPLSSLVFLSYLKTLKSQRKRDKIIIKNLEKLFLFFQETEIHCHEDVVDDIIQSFNLGKKTTVTFSGYCRNCKEKLERYDLTDDEFSGLKDVFFKNVIVGKDIFIKSNPKEMSRFVQFVKTMGKFDVVLDGLNIAYSSGLQKGPQIFAKKLCHVIAHFLDQNKSVLMLGRVHMTKWPKLSWNYIKENSAVFLTQDISQDDPYLLYCALHSGKDTIIVTRDLMRGHKFLLKDRKYKVLFDRWLSQRQYYLLTINQDGKVFFRPPPHFSAVTQRKEDVWHIPYVPRADESVNESYHKTWICINYD